MKRSEIKLGGEYVVKVGGKYGFTVRETVIAFEGKTIITRGGYGERCSRTPRNFVKPAVVWTKRTPEQDMNALVAFADGGFSTPSVEKTKPAVVAYTNDEFGLPLLTAPRSTRDTLTLVRCMCDHAACKACRDQRAAKHAAVYSEAMARS